MFSAPYSRSSGPGSSPGWGHCVVFLGKTLYSHSAWALSTQVYKRVPANSMLRGKTPVIDQLSRNLDKLLLDGPLGSYADFTYLILMIT